MGGSFASLLLQRRNIHIDHIFIGSSDMDQASPFVARIETALIWKMMSGFAKDPEKSIAKMKKRMAKKNMSIGTTPDGKEADGTFMVCKSNMAVFLPGIFFISKRKFAGK